MDTLLYSSYSLNLKFGVAPRFAEDISIYYFLVRRDWSLYKEWTHTGKPTSESISS